MAFLKQVRNALKKSYTFSQLMPSWRENTPAWNDWSTENAIRNGYKSSTYVFSCINAISKASASVPWKVYRTNANGEAVEIPNHPLKELIDKPNPFHSRKDLMERMTTNLYLGGNAYFSKVRANGIVAELWSLPADHIKVIPSKENFISHYEYEAEGVRERIEPRDIIHNLFTNPSNPYYGLSPLQAGAKAVDTDIEAVGWNKVALQNRAITDGVFTFEQPLTREQWEEAREMVREEHQGKENARTPWVLGAGAKWQQLSLSPAEMDFIESRRFTRSEICSIFQVPPPIVGIYDDATLANIETARKIFWLDTVIPYLEDIKSCLNTALAPEFGENIILDYDVSNVEAIQTNMTEKLTNAKTLWSMGVPFNDINQRLELGFDDIEGGEVGYLPTSVIPADLDIFEDNLEQEEQGQASEEEEETEEDDEDQPKSQQKPRKFKRKQKKNTNTPDKQKTALFASKGLNLQTDEHKEFYWKAMERRRAVWYLAGTRKAERLFKDEAKEVSKLLQQGKEKEALDFIDQNKKAWEKWLASFMQGIIEEVGKETYEGLKSAHGPTETKDEEDAFNPWERTIQNYIRRAVGEKITYVSQTTKAKVRAVIDRVREEDGTLDQIAKAVRESYSDFSRYRSYRIARTEVVGASNYASIKSAEQSEVVEQKEWVTSVDDRVRETHEAVHGERVGLKERFSNGLEFPADYSAGQPAETIHCRCTIAYYTE